VGSIISYPRPIKRQKSINFWLGIGFEFILILKKKKETKKKKEEEGGRNLSKCTLNPKCTFFIKKTSQNMEVG